MSNVVDERIVEMRFDNAQFEKNVQTSMSTLEKLKKSLKLSDSSKELENVGKAAEKVNFSNMEKSLAALEKRFSVTGIIGMQVIKNLTNSAMGFVGKVNNFVKSGVVTGGINRAMKLENAQFQLGILLKDGKEVEAVMQNVNAAVDGTAYSLDAAATVASQLAASGMKAGDQMQQSLQAVAGVAAMTNSSYEDIGRIFTQVAGQGRLMGNDLLQLSGRGMNAAATLGEALGKSESEVRDMVSKGQVSFEMFSDAMYKAFGDGAKKANETFNGSMSNLKSAFARIGALFVAPLIKSNGPIVTFFNTLRERVNELKVYMVPVADTVVNVVTSIINAVTNLAKKLNVDKIFSVFVKGGAMVGQAMKRVGELMDPVKSILEGVSKPAKEAATAVQNIGSSLGDLGAIADKVIRGDFGNGADRLNALTQAGRNYYEIQNKVNEKLNCSFRYTQDQIDAQDKLLGIQKKTSDATQVSANSTGNLSNEQKELLKSLIKLDDEQLRQKNLTEDQIKALNELKSISKKLGVPIDQLIDQMDEINAKWLIMDSFTNIGKAIAKVFKTIGQAFKEVFEPVKPETIYNIIAGFHRLSSAMIMSEETTDKLKRTFKGLFAAIDIVRTLAGGAFSVAFRVFAKALGTADVGVLDFTSRIGDMIVKLRDFLFNNELVNKGVDLLATGLEKLGEIFGKVIDLIAHNPISQKLISFWDNLFNPNIESNGSGIVNVLKKLGDAMDISGEKSDNFKDVMEGINSAFNISNWKWAASLSSTLAVVNSVLNLFGTDLAHVGADIANYINKFADFVSVHTPFINMQSKIAAALQTVIVGVNNCINAFLKLKPVQEIVKRFSDLVVKMFGDVSKGISSVNIDGFCNKLKTAFESIEKWIKGLNNSEHLGIDIVHGIGKGLLSGIHIAIKSISKVAKAIIETFCDIWGIHSPARKGIELATYIIEGIAEGLKSGLNLINDAIAYVANSIEKGLSGVHVKVNKNFTNLIESVKKVYKNFVKLVQSIDFTKLLAIIPIGITLLFAKKIWDLAKALQGGITGINSVITNFATIEAKFAKVLDAFATDIKARALEKVAISIGILCASVIALSFIDTDKLVGATACVITLAGVLTGLLFAVSKIDNAAVKLDKKGVDISGLKTTIIQIGGAILMIAAAAKIMGTMKPEEITQGFLGLAVSIAAIGTVLLAFGGLARMDATKNIDKAGSMILKVSVAMLLMVKVCKLASQLSVDEMKKAGVFALAFSAFVAVMAGLYRLAGNGVNKLGGMLIKMTIALGLMVGVCKLIAQLKPEEMSKATKFAAGFTVFVLALRVISSIFPNARVQKLSGMMISMTVALGLMVGVCKLVAKLNIKEVVYGIGYMTVFTAFIACLVRVSTIASTQQIAKTTGTILAMSVALGAMAAICTIVGMLPGDMLAKGIAAVTAFSAMMAIMVFSAQGVTDIKGTIMMMAASIGIMAASISVLSFMNQDKIANATICMSILMGMFSLIEHNAKNIKASTGTIVAMSTSIAIIAGAMYVLSNIPTNNAITTAGSIAIVLTALSTALVIAGKAKGMSNRAMASMGVMVLALYGVATVIGILMNLKGIDNAIKVSLSLSTILIGISASMLILSKMSDSGIDTKGLIKFALTVGTLTVALSALVPSLQTLDGVNWSSLAKAGVALVGLAGGLSLMNGTVSGAASLLIVAAALTVLTPVLERLGSMSSGNITKSLLALAGTFTIIGVAATLLSGAIVPIMGLSAALAVLGVAALAFGAGIALLGKGLTDIATVGSSAANELVDSIGILITGILGLIPQMTASVTQAIVAVCQVLTDSAPVIATTLVTLLNNVILSMANSQATMIESLATLVLNVLNGLTSKLPELVDALSKFVVTLLNSLSDHMPEFISAGISFVGSIIQGISDQIGPLVQNILVPLLSVFSDCITGLVTAIGPYIPTICDCFVQLTQIVTNSIVQIVQALAPFIPNLQAIVQSVTVGVVAICNAFVSLVNQIGPIINAITGLIQQLGNSISQILLSIAVIIQTCGNVISQSLQGISNIFQTVFTGIADIITSTGETIKMALEGVADIIDSAFSGIGDVISSVGSSIKSVLDGIAGVIKSVGEAALNAGNGFNKLANGVKTITNLNLADMGASLAVVAKGIKDIASNSEGLASAGSGMREIAAGVQTSTMAFSMMITGVQLIVTALQSIGPVASSSMSILTTAITSSSSSFTTFSIMITTSIASAMSMMVMTVTSQSALIISAFDNMMTNVANTISGKQGIFSSAGLSMMNGLQSGISSGAASIIPILSTLMTSMTMVVLGRSSSFITAGSTLMTGMASGLLSGSSVVINNATSAITRIIAIIIGQRGRFQSSGAQLMSGLGAGISSGTSTVISLLSSLMTRANNTVTSRKGQFQNAGRTLMSALAGSIRSGASSVNTAISAAMSNCASAIRAYRGSFESAGGYLGDGLIIGINSKKTAAYNAGFALGKAAVDGEKAGQQSHSPSKLTKKAGRWLGEGLVIGMEQMGKTVYQSGKAMGTRAVDSISGALSNIQTLSEDSLDMAPTLRPVVDLDSLQNGDDTLQIGADLSASLLSGPVTTLKDIISDAQSSINASNDRVIKAIDELRSDMSEYYASDDSELALYIDSKKMASTIAKPMNRQLLELQKRGAR